MVGKANTGIVLTNTTFISFISYNGFDDYAIVLQ